MPDAASPLAPESTPLRDPAPEPPLGSQRRMNVSNMARALKCCNAVRLRSSSPHRASVPRRACALHAAGAADYPAIEWGYGAARHACHRSVSRAACSKPLSGPMLHVCTRWTKKSLRVRKNGSGNIAMTPLETNMAHRVRLLRGATTCGAG